ncbi:MAG: response regulator transcription factor [Eubacteriales bacterium]|nr:response regulator transcription factor [Eubacteriales bacterium]
MKNIIVCDDDKEIVDAISIYLQSEGYKTFKCYDGSEVSEIFNNNTIDLIILDVMMPKQDGIQTTFKLREKNKEVPIIILSAKSEDTDKILGLNIGADDYITKPFNPLELIARVKSILRRNENNKENIDNIPKTKKIIIDNLTIDNEAKSVYLDDKLIKFTPLEYQILFLLASNPGKVFSIEEIYKEVWKYSSYGQENSVTVHIRHIREKIEFDTKNPRFIKVIWGVGYKCVNNNQKVIMS